MTKLVRYRLAYSEKLKSNCKKLSSHLKYYKNRDFGTKVTQITILACIGLQVTEAYSVTADAALCFQRYSPTEVAVMPLSLAVKHVALSGH